MWPSSRPTSAIRSASNTGLRTRAVTRVAPLCRGATRRGGGFTEPDVHPWLPLGDTNVNVASQRADPESMLNLTRDLIALRKEIPDLAVGRYVPLPAPEGVWAWRRGDRHAVIVNYSDSSAALNEIAGRVLIGTDRGRDGESFADSLAVRGWEGLVVELDE